MPFIKHCTMFVCYFVICCPIMKHVWSWSKDHRLVVIRVSQECHCPFCRLACGDVLRSPRGTLAFPGEPAKPRSWPSTEYTSDTALASAHRRSASRATGGRGWKPVSSPQSNHCGGTSCTGGRPPLPSLSHLGQSHLQRKINTALQISLDVSMQLHANVEQPVCEPSHALDCTVKMAGMDEDADIDQASRESFLDQCTGILDSVRSSIEIKYFGTPSWLHWSVRLNHGLVARLRMKLEL